MNACFWPIRATKLLSQPMPKRPGAIRDLALDPGHAAPKDSEHRHWLALRLEGLAPNEATERFIGRVDLHAGSTTSLASTLIFDAIELALCAVPLIYRKDFATNVICHDGAIRNAFNE